MNYYKIFNKFFYKIFNKKYIQYYVIAILFVIILSIYFYFYNISEGLYISNRLCSVKDTKPGYYKLMEDEDCIQRIPLDLNKLNYKEITYVCPTNTALASNDLNTNFNSKISTLEYTYSPQHPTCYTYKKYICKTNPNFYVKIDSFGNASVYKDGSLVTIPNGISPHTYFAERCCEKGVIAGCDEICGSGKILDISTPIKKCCLPFTQLGTDLTMKGCDGICGSRKINDNSNPKQCCLPYSDTGDASTTIGCDGICGSGKKKDKSSPTKCCLPYSDTGDASTMMGCDGVCGSGRKKDKRGDCCKSDDVDCAGNCKSRLLSGEDRSNKLDKNGFCCLYSDLDCSNVCRSRPGYYTDGSQATLDSNGKCCFDSWKDPNSKVPNGVCTDKDQTSPQKPPSCPTGLWLDGNYKCCNDVNAQEKRCCPNTDQYLQMSGGLQGYVCKDKPRADQVYTMSMPKPPPR
jgi:hypothetical protein